MSEQPAQLTLESARRLDRMFREWEAFKAATGSNTSPVQGVMLSLNAPLAWITLTAKSSIGTQKYRYTCSVQPTPFGPKLSPAQAALASTQTAYSAAEFGSVQPGTDAITTLNGAPVLAQMFWTFVESNDPATGYWAWWFTPGGGGALPTGEYQYMAYQMTSDNQAGWDFIRAHPVL